MLPSHKNTNRMSFPANHNTFRIKESSVRRAISGRRKESTVLNNDIEPNYKYSMFFIKGFAESTGVASSDWARIKTPSGPFFRKERPVSGIAVTHVGASYH
ncbi:hypothetical protein TNCV_941081 [Trichonephila clavipes]|nr:hypothetical protein TNCV_941081 [Trichonephila clavipes]